MSSLSQKHNKKIVCLGMYQTCCDIFIPAHPLEILPYFAKADFVITDTFHGSIFSIKGKTPFATIIRKSNQEKLSDLLNRFELSDRRLYDINDLEAFYNKPIDFTRSYELIDIQREKALKYLNENL